MKKLLAALLLLLPGLAWGQGAVRQGGSVVKFDVPAWVQDRTIMSGNKSWLDNFRGFNTSHFFDNHGAGVCTEDALTNGPYHQLCLGHDADGNAQLTVDSFNGASLQGLSARLNGTAYPVIATVTGIPMAVSKTALGLLSTTTYPNVLRVGFTVAGDVPPLLYVASPSACTKNAGAGDGGSEIPSSNGKCWLAQFPSSGVDVRQFGADSTGIADSVAAVNAMFALGSNHKFIFPPGTYLIGSNSASPYPLVEGNLGYRLHGTSGNHLLNIKIEGQGAVITTPNGANNINYFSYDFIDGLEVRGLTFLANATALPAGSEMTGMIMRHITSATISDIHYTGNWGGSTREPAAVAMEWIQNSIFQNFVIDHGSLCFDAAFLQGVTFSNIVAVGADDTGGANTQARGGCISIQYDVAMQTNYPYTFSTTKGVRVVGSDISHFAQAAFIRAGSLLTFIGNSFHDNGGATNPIGVGWGKGAGIFFVSDGSSSDLDPVVNVSVTGGTITNNGNIVAGGGIIMDASAGTAGWGNFNFSGIQFWANAPGHIISPSVSHLSAIDLGVNSYNNATTAVDLNTISLLTNGSNSQVGQSCSSNWNPAAATTAYCNGFLTNTEGSVAQTLNRPGQFSKMYVTAAPGPGVGHTYTFTLRVSGADSAIVCSVTGAANTCSDLTHVSAFPGEATFDIKMVSDAGAPATQITWSARMIQP